MGAGNALSVTCYPNAPSAPAAQCHRQLVTGLFIKVPLQVGTKQCDLLLLQFRFLDALKRLLESTAMSENLTHLFVLRLPCTVWCIVTFPYVTSSSLTYWSTIMYSELVGLAVAITVVMVRKCPGRNIPSAACQQDGKALASSSAH